MIFLVDTNASEYIFPKYPHNIARHATPHSMESCCFISGILLLIS